jgi:hypothetical protein
MDKLDEAAEFSVARGSGFAGLAIFVLMIAMIYEPRQSFEIGGVCCLIACLTLVLMATSAEKTPYKRTEVWLLLDASDRPTAEVAQRLITGARRMAFLKFAHMWGSLAAAMLTVAIVMRWLSLGGRLAM